ncbi:HalOD1 output domain-containing protein [Natrialbaceae archaeon GCM10025810]|uniref:HalOD1 output domain-containing protein n=1 Tax=Halovalidus salilacus TaxID=3075124 RepID=UPI003605D948
MIATALPDDEPTATSVTESIVTAVADAADEDTLDLPPLWDVVDPEALDALFAPMKTGASRAGRVEFDYYGYRVRVDAGESTTVSLLGGE